MKTDSSALQIRRDVEARIKEYEALGGDNFFRDVENDPPTKTLMPDDVDYLCEKPKNRFHRTVAEAMENVCAIIVNRKYRIRVDGAENISGIRGGAVITSNHFSITENLAVKAAAKKANGKHRFCKVVREGNFNMPGIVGYLLRHCDTLPLSGNFHTMLKLSDAMDKLLKSGAIVLVYPEQAMWHNYKKPRPYRLGAYYYAAKSDVPVIPCFTTLSDSGKKDRLGFTEYYYTIHIMPPIYPSAGLTVKQNACAMQEKNYSLCKQKYEQVYGIPLSYTGDESSRGLF